MRPVRALLLTLHIVGVAGWLGGGLFSSISFASLARTIGLKPVLDLSASLGGKFFGTAVGLVVLSGVGLVLTSDAYGWGSGFVLVGIGVVLADGVLEGAVFGPRLKRLAAAGEERTDTYVRTLAVSSAIHVALLLLALWSMVVRLGA